MLRNIIRPRAVVHTEYEIVYDDGRGNGFGFPCDAFGNIFSDLEKPALENLEMCKAHPEMFERCGEVVSYRWTYTEPGYGDCICGQKVTLENQFQGSCQCPKCGRWYNLFGQELIQPEYWEE